ncbi:MAG: hypothetical protein HQ481_06950 [Alphaproteobacteria bacterium]|nr:hypothetical protein [Alphaproteobacteria bacterium]
MPTLGEILYALHGALRVFRGDAGGFACFRPGVEGFWVAAWAALISLPAHLVMVGVQITHNPALELGLGVLLVEALVFVIVWFGYAFAAHFALALIAREDRYFDYMNAVFWTAVPQIYLQFIVAMLDVVGLLPGPLTGLATIGVVVAVLWYRWFVAKAALDVTSGTAVLVVIATLVFEFVLTALLSPVI